LLRAVTFCSNLRTVIKMLHYIFSLNGITGVFWPVSIGF